ncbi:MAG: TonB-dependent receptor [Acidobacteria bacterium]|nr:TonB-dependent receptor [Acidobacteriota bacterium]
MRFLTFFILVLPLAAQTPSRGRLDRAAQRNENVVVYQIDTNAIKEMGVRLGDDVTIVSEPPAEVNQYATEHGRPAGEAVALRPSRIPAGWHGEAYESHQSSLFNARTFFQVGGVKPSHRNAYGGRLTGELGKGWWLTANAGQRKIRGMVNGNVLVPLPGERTPLTADPGMRAMVSHWLAAYPAELPNRTDFDPRALNTNAPQRIDDTDATLRLERDLGKRDRLVISETLNRQRIDAFQLVAGQNPDTELHSHRARLSWRRELGAGSELLAGFGFNRTRSVLLPEPNAVGPRVRMGYQFEELGPDSQFPINRAHNTFRWGALWSQQAAGGRHQWTLGGDFSRFRLNGIETNNQRPLIWFTSGNGRTAIENFRLGSSSLYEVTLGEMARGYRSWSGDVFFADKWKATSALDVYLGLRYNLETAPVEVDGLDKVPYLCDCNNFSPRVALAWRAGHGWVMRASYTVSFAQIPPVTYQQVRINLPLVRYVQVQNPDLLNPLGKANLDPGGRTAPTFFSPGLVSPYAHQYNFTLERRLANLWQLRLGYVGSRSFKLMNVYIQNRAEPVPGIPLTTATVDQRRPDPRYYEVKHILNGGIAYLDAAQATLQMPLRRGFAWSASYTFGKAIDEGSDYAFTAANKDLSTARSQWQYDSLKDKKGLSTFDSTHALLISYSYDLPRLVRGTHWLGKMAGGWQVSGVTMLKSGTPLTLYVGSDAPGYGNVDGGPSDRPNIVDPSILGMTIGHPDTAPLIMRRDRFAFIQPGEHRGSVARGAFRKAGIANFNAALSKLWRFHAGREWSAILRGEAYNLTNHAQFDEPQRNLSSPSFGRITNTLNDGRVLQIGLRLVM